MRAQFGTPIFMVILGLLIAAYGLWLILTGGSVATGVLAIIFGLIFAVVTYVISSQANRMFSLTWQILNSGRGSDRQDTEQRARETANQAGISSQASTPRRPTLGRTIFGVIVALIVIGIGGWLIEVGGSANGWVNATGTVTSVNITTQTTRTSHGSGITYEAVIRYTYTYSGIDHAGTWIGNAGGDTYGDAQTTVSAHPVGFSILILVNPTDTSESKPVYDLSHSAFGGDLFLGVGLIFLVFVIYSYVKKHY